MAAQGLEDDVNVDIYTKAVLTVIALALVALAARLAIPSAHATFGDCGSYAFSPCYMQLVR